MANPEHLTLVQRGAAAIAAWRDRHPGERLDLEKADLAGIDLRGANLHGARFHEADLHAADLAGANLQNAGFRAAYLVQANLHGARLQHAYLVRANLEQACLSWARLQRAHLHGAHLQEANLQEANLQRAHLLWTYLVGADLRGAYLEHADLQWANLQAANLAEARLQEANLQEAVVRDTLFDTTHLHAARGLDTCRHESTSALDVGTLARSGCLAPAFLRGCGWSETRLASVAELLQERPVSVSVERAFAFPTAYGQAGLYLLTYFGSVLRQQYPDVALSYRLEQSGPLVRLLIETSTAHRDAVEQTLQTYGLVVAEQQPPEAWLADPVQAQQLRQQLEVAATVLRLTHDLGPPSESPDIPLPPTFTERLRHWRQLLGQVLYDL